MFTPITREDGTVDMVHVDAEAMNAEAARVASLLPPPPQELLDDIPNVLATEYRRHRAVEYPQIYDQLDMLWHAMDDGTLPKVDSFYDAIKTIKDKYPKSE
jgi:hypothetical protein